MWSLCIESIFHETDTTITITKEMPEKVSQGTRAGEYTIFKSNLRDMAGISGSGYPQLSTSTTCSSPFLKRARLVDQSPRPPIEVRGCNGRRKRGRINKSYVLTIGVVANSSRSSCGDKVMPKVKDFLRKRYVSRGAMAE